MARRALVPALAGLLAVACGGDPAAPPAADLPDVGADVPDAVVLADVADGVDDVPDVPDVPDVSDLPEEPRPLACDPPPDLQPGPGVVVLDQGAVTGELAGASWTYKGIPYGAPPVGDLRWRPTEPAGCFDGGVHDGEAYGPACPQRADVTGSAFGEEDCLTLNVWTPDAAPPADGWPVLVYLHGGANIQSSASRELPGGKAAVYDSRYLAPMGEVIVVTLNFRLGVLGFMAHPALTAESPHAASGNYGVHDQIAALDWVQANIAAFGGDPKRVLLFGQSAGGIDVCTLIASPLAAGRFHAALIQSGGCGARPLESAHAAGEARVAATACADAEDVLGCLRAMDVLELVAAMPAQITIGQLQLVTPDDQLGPVIDGHLLPGPPLQRIQVGEHNAVPFAIGTNADEMADLVEAEIDTVEAYEAAVLDLLAPVEPELAQQLLAAYPPDELGGPQAALAQLMGDVRFHCPARGIARIFATGQGQPVFRYLFARRSETPAGTRPATHGFELVFVFRTMLLIPGWDPELPDLQLSAEMIGYWSRLAAGGDPNGDDAAAWPAYELEADPYVIFEDPISTGEGLFSDRCDLWEQVAVQ